MCASIRLRARGRRHNVVCRGTWTGGGGGGEGGGGEEGRGVEGGNI